MKSYLGSYTLAPGAGPGEATVLVFDKTINIGFRNEDGAHSTEEWDIRDAEATYNPATQSTHLRHLARKSIEIIVTGPELAAFVKEMQQERNKPWHQSKEAAEWKRNLLLFLGISAVLVLLYFLLVPWAAGKMAGTVSPDTEAGFGDAVYNAMALESETDTAATYAINEFFAALEVSTPYRIRIAVVKSEVINAFALPGGRIVVYTGLLKKTGTYPELAALLLHEFIHVHNRHATRSIFRRLGSRVFTRLLFGRIGSVTAVLANHADAIKSLTYSRRLEKEADMEGLALLQAREIDGNGFADLFRHLKESSPGPSLPEFLASHPDIDKRAAYIREAAAGTPVTDHPQLKIIFDKLKQTIQP